MPRKSFASEGIITKLRQIGVLKGQQQSVAGRSPRDRFLGAEVLVSVKGMGLAVIQASK